MTDLLNQQRKDYRELKKALIEMAEKVGLSIHALDEVMKAPKPQEHSDQVPF